MLAGNKRLVWVLVSLWSMGVGLINYARDSIVPAMLCAVVGLVCAEIATRRE